MLFMWCIIFTGSTVTLFASEGFTDKATVYKMHPSSESDSLPVIPWTDSIERLLLEDPLFKLSSEAGTAAKGWIAANKEGFIFHLDVIDDYHINTRKEGAIWDGDAIQLGIDANGSGVGNRNRRMAYVGPDDASITFALTNEGPRAWAHYHGNADKLNAITDMKMDIVRNRKIKHTIYTLWFKWEDFQIGPGLYDTMGFGVQLNDTDKGPDQLRLKWGDGAGGNLRPGLFEKVRIASPTDEFITILPQKVNVWHPQDSIRVLLAKYTKSDWTLHLKKRNYEFMKDFTANKYPRYSIAIAPDKYYNTEEYDIEVISGENRASIHISPKYPAQIIEKLFRVIDEKLKDENNPLGVKHILGIKDIVADVWSKAQANLKVDEYDARLCAEYSQYLYDEIKNYNHVGSLIERGAKQKVCTFNASSDSTLQYYKLLLPKNFDPNKEYSLIVDLHGAGNPYTLSFFASAENKTIGTEEILENEFEVFVLQPWGRGNMGYWDNAGEDIYDSIHDLMETYKINKEKIYLTGFSMGGMGSWTHSLLHPEIWRAVVIASGGPRITPEVEKIPVLKKLPIMIWHGDSDGAVSVKNAYKMEKSLKSIGNIPEMKIIPGRGHMITAEDRFEIYEWLLDH